MKLGEALSLRSLQAQRLNDLRSRIMRNVVGQEGQQVAEDPYKLMKEFDQLSFEHRNLVVRINTANTENNMLEQLQEREHLRRMKNTLEQAAAVAVPGVGRYMRSEIAYVSNVDVAKLQSDIDELIDDIRAIDALIQERNWQIDI